ncbi:uncharacterized protein BDZ83DRAFT_4880 [Colletotrichum acutatum]|uniref:Uncharacterized protein n=1 Tax=Glomerella acutata TaxID=27357 RepID=A0AAD8XR19_GLOAC|nr:uncharacterized protein BDZ83DRAFT_4880 [Colletotrichum acutatum]KAK1731787.1 hypothetical protein BDZ83DRAFT_4880 [Colletotrichum acutatum]
MQKAASRNSGLTENSLLLPTAQPLLAEAGGGGGAGVDEDTNFDDIGKNRYPSPSFPRRQPSRTYPASRRARGKFGMLETLPGTWVFAADDLGEFELLAGSRTDRRERIEASDRLALVTSPSRTAFLSAASPLSRAKQLVGEKKSRLPPDGAALKIDSTRTGWSGWRGGRARMTKKPVRSIENDLMDCWRSNSRRKPRCDSRKQDFSTFRLPRASHIGGLYILFRARLAPPTRSTHGPLTGRPRYESINTEPIRSASKQRAAVVACKPGTS